MAKKLVSLILLIFTFIAHPCFAKDKEKLFTKDEIKNMQTRIYKNKTPEEIMPAIIKVLEALDYKNVYIYDDLGYLTADKNFRVKDINKMLIAGYVAKTGFDIFQAILTYGIKSYSVIGDLALIKIEFNDKDVNLHVAVNIIPEENQTTVRINILSLMTGKRDGLFIGKQNRLKTIHIKDESMYKIFFYRLRKQLYQSDQRI